MVLDPWNDEGSDLNDSCTVYSIISDDSNHEVLRKNWRFWKYGRNKKEDENNKEMVSGCGDGDGCESGNESVEVVSNQVSSLVEIAARFVGRNLPFEQVELHQPPIADELQLRIAFLSFPESCREIYLYSCLSNESNHAFNAGEQLYQDEEVVFNVLQIGFCLTAKITKPQSFVFEVTILFDRGLITSCKCSCDAKNMWCAHCVAVCLFRIRKAYCVALRPPISDSLSNLDRIQLRKFAQYLISENPKILPSAQLIIDKLTNKQDSVIKDVSGAPDVTAGPSISDNSVWCLDSSSIRSKINSVFYKFCVPSPMVCSDVIYLSNSSPYIVSERNCWLRALNNIDPEGIWNLLKIVRNMFMVKDRNAIQLLKIITEELLGFDQIVLWWFMTKGNVNDVNQKTCTKIKSFVTQHSAAKMCDEVVESWRLAVLNPALSPLEKNKIYAMLITYQNSIKETILLTKYFSLCDEIYSVFEKPAGAKNPKKFPVGDSTKDTFTFDGFKEALIACFFDWSNYTIPGVTYSNLQNTQSYMPYVWDQVDIEEQRCPKLFMSSKTNSFVYDMSVASLDQQIKELSIDSSEKDSFQRRCYRAEGLLAHGHKNESYPIFAELAIELMENWHVLNDQFVETQRSSKNSKCFSGKNFVSDCKIAFVVKTIRLCFFFAKVLKKIAQFEMLAFKVALFGLEIPREPTIRKSLEVWLSLQESEILTFLNGFEMNNEKVTWLLKKADSIQIGELHRDLVLLVNLIHFIFESVVEKNNSIPLSAEYEEVVFSIAIDALDIKKGASEVDHPLLAENIRMQRKNLILKMIFHYVNKPARLVRIMSKLLSDNIHQFKCFKLRESYYSEHQVPQSDTSILFKTKIQEYRNQNRAPQDCTDFDFFSIFPIVNSANLQQSTIRHKPSKKNTNKNRNKGGQSSSSGGGSCGNSKSQSQSSSSANSFDAVDANIAFTCNSNSTATTLSDYNRPSENIAFYYADLSKAIFSKARDGYDDFSQILSFIRSEQINYSSNKNNISLFMCALQLYMYSLSINNWHSMNWYYRNYSSQAITISNIAIEHGTPAIAFITDYWHSHLSPSEALTIAETGFRCNRDDDLTKENVSVLALSVLSHCEWLNAEQIDKALSFCKLFSLDYLEYGCLIVENASLLFASKNHANTTSTQSNATAVGNYAKNKNTTGNLSHKSSSASDGGNENSGYGKNHSCENLNVPLVNTSFNAFGVNKSASNYYIKTRIMFKVARYWFDLYWSINPKPTFTDYNLKELFSCDMETDQTSFSYIYPMINVGNFFNANGLSELQKLYIRSFYSSIYHPILFPVFVPNQPRTNFCMFDAIELINALNETQLRVEQNDEMAEKRQFYLLSVHRVGLIALDFLAKSNDNSKSYKYFTQVPPYSISIIWHLRVAKYLGGIYLQQFCNSILNSISSPYLLYDICCEAAFYYSSVDNDLFIRHLGSTFLPLVRKCQQNFLIYLEYKFNGKCLIDEFYSIFKAAYSAMALTPGHFHLLWNCVAKAKRKHPPTPNFWVQFDEKIIRETSLT